MVDCLLRRARVFGDHPPRDKEHHLASPKCRRESTPQIPVNAAFDQGCRRRRPGSSAGAASSVAPIARAPASAPNRNITEKESGAAGDITIVRPAAAAPPRRTEQIEIRQFRSTRLSIRAVGGVDPVAPQGPHRRSLRSPELQRRPRTGISLKRNPAPPATSPSCGQQPPHHPGGPSRSRSERATVGAAEFAIVGDDPVAGCARPAPAPSPPPGRLALPSSERQKARQGDPRRLSIRFHTSACALFRTACTLFRIERLRPARGTGRRRLGERRVEGHALHSDLPFRLSVAYGAPVSSAITEQSGAKRQFRLRDVTLFTDRRSEYFMTNFPSRPGSGPPHTRQVI